MLMMNRKVGDTVTAGEISFVIVRVSRHRIRIGIQAPKSVEIVVTESPEPDGNRTADGEIDGNRGAPAPDSGAKFNHPVTRSFRPKGDA